MLYVLTVIEFCERFGYYGMRALLVLTLVAGTTSANPGFGWTKADALNLYGSFMALLYLTPLPGGWLADRWLGQRRCTAFGGFTMASGLFLLSTAVPDHASHFLAGLALIVIGSGLFKPNVIAMVGQLYPPGDRRRDEAYSILYTGIGIGAFAAPLVCSTLGEHPGIGWRMGYLAAAIGMTVSVILQWIFAKPLARATQACFRRDTPRQPEHRAPLKQVGKERLRVLAVLFAFLVLFWAAFEQAGGLMNLYASEKVNRELVTGFRIPAGWLQSVTPLATILFTPLSGMLWRSLSRRSIDISAPRKIVYGLTFTALGFTSMAAAVLEQRAHGLASMDWLMLAYLLHAMGLVCIAPVGMALVAQLAPREWAGLAMGAWLLINFVAGKLQGWIGAQAATVGELAVFTSLALALFAAAGLLRLILGMLISWMHNEHQTTIDDLSRPSASRS